MRRYFQIFPAAVMAMCFCVAICAAGEKEVSLDDAYFAEENIELTAKERNALAIARGWQRGDIMTENPVIGPDGSIEYLFGAEQPSVVCAVMQITDIELERGESVTSVNLGDSVRWQVQPAVSGGDVTHILVRPKQVGLETSMVVTTDRRTYHIRLSSQRTGYMSRVKFFYIEDAISKWQAIQSVAAAKREAATIPETNEYLGDLDFGYEVSGRASWKPVRVYNDSVKTILEMPATFRQEDAPTLLVVRKEGRLFQKSEQVMVNYRVQNGRYIVDSVFDQAVLVVGVGGNQERVTITRKPERGKN